VVGVPTVHVLKPAPSLRSNCVVVRLTKVPTDADGKIDLVSFRAGFEAEALRQLSKLGIEAEVEIGGRQQVRVGAQRILGFRLTVSGLSPEHSLALQVHGLGGKHRMGCGVFSPVGLRS
jgi:CRISPR-associated protein Cas6